MELIKIDKRFTHTNHLTGDDVLILKDVLRFNNCELIDYEKKRLMCEYVDENGFKRYMNIWNGQVFILCFNVKGLDKDLFYLVPRVFKESTFNYYSKKIGCYYTVIHV